MKTPRKPNFFTRLYRVLVPLPRRMRWRLFFANDAPERITQAVRDGYNVGWQVMIRCDNCGLVQLAQVEFRAGAPFPTMFHGCLCCGKTIMEDEWDEVHDLHINDDLADLGRQQLTATAVGSLTAELRRRAKDAEQEARDAACPSDALRHTARMAAYEAAAALVWQTSAQGGAVAPGNDVPPAVIGGPDQPVAAIVSGDARPAPAAPDQPASGDQPPGGSTCEPE